LIPRRARLAGGRDPLLTPQRRERGAYTRGLVALGRVDERALRGLGGRAQQIGMIACHHDLAVLIPLERAGAAFANRNTRALRCAESNRDEADPLLRGALRFRDDVLHRLERLSI